SAATRSETNGKFAARTCPGAMPISAATMLRTEPSASAIARAEKGARDRGSPTRSGQDSDAAGARPRPHSLHGRRHNRVRHLERDLEVAGGHLSGWRSAVHTRGLFAHRLRAVHPAADRPHGVPHQPPPRPRDAFAVADLLPDLPDDRLQPDAARE